MSRILSYETPCTVCHVTMPVGTRVYGSKAANARHYDGCPAEAIERIATGATQKQVDYAESLQQRYYTPAVYQRRYSHDEFVAMRRDEISGVIDALLSERCAQEA